MSLVTGSLLAVSPTPYREGQILVVPAGATLPPNCVKCGSPASVSFLKKNFAWHSPWLYLLILAGVLLYAIVALIVSKRMTLQVPFCEEHRRARTRLKWIAASLLIGFIPVGIAMGEFEVGGGWIALTMIAMVLGGLIAIGILGGSFAPTFIDQSHGKFKGAGEGFLAVLPQQK